MEAVEAENVVAPRVRGQLKIVELFPEGEQVAVGDLLVQFEQTDFHKRVMDDEQEVESAKADLEKTLATQKAEIARLEADIANIKAEKPGLVVYGKVWKGERPEKIRVGDEIWGGVNVISLPDLSHMQVKTYVNEIEVNKLDTGQVATIKLDALPEPTFHGKIKSIASLGREKEGKNAMLSIGEGAKQESLEQIRQMGTAKRVCVLGADAKRALFFFDNPLGGRVKIRNQWFTVIGVLEDKGAAGGKIGGVLEVRNTDEDIYVPLTALLNRFHREAGEPELTQITVKIPNSDQLPEAAAIVRTILNRRHRGVEDFKWS